MYLKEAFWGTPKRTFIISCLQVQLRNLYIHSELYLNILVTGSSSVQRQLFLLVSDGSVSLVLQ